jgi:hypothetical protein
LLNTNGVVSGDYTLQLYYRSGEFQEGRDAATDAAPVIGSPEYVTLHGDACLHAPKLEKRHFGQVATVNVMDIDKPLFVPASLTKLTIPASACRFISDAEAELKAKDPMRPWDDPLSREWTEYLISHLVDANSHVIATVSDVDIQIQSPKVTDLSLLKAEILAGNLKVGGMLEPYSVESASDVSECGLRFRVDQIFENAWRARTRSDSGKLMKAH